MSIEIEKKYRLDQESRERIEADLTDSAAEFVGRDFEENTIYSNDDLAGRGAIVRIRRTERRSLLTFKRRIANDTGVKQQIEHETEIGDAQIAESIIAELGLKPVVVYEKWRDTWRFRSVEVVIDELPFGLFMEIEGTLTGIREAEMLLDIEDLETVHETYPTLTAKLGWRTGAVTEARFVKE